MLDFSDIRTGIGWALMLGGLAIGAYVYGIPDTGGPLQMTALQQERVPLEIFKWAMFTVFAGAMAMLLKAYADRRDAAARAAAEAAALRQAEREEQARAAREFREKVIEIYTGFKAVRRELRARATYANGAPIRLRRVTFFILYSRLNELQHRMEALHWQLNLAHDFLGQAQGDVSERVKRIERFTERVVGAGSTFDELDPEDCVTVAPGSDLFEFLQPNRTRPAPSTVNREFFYPMMELRKMLAARVATLDDTDEDEA